MLLFIDESYRADPKGGFFHALAGFVINERRYRALVAAVHQSKLALCFDARNLPSEEFRELCRTKVPVRQDVETMEIKSTDLLSAKLAARHASHSDSPGILLAQRLLGALVDTKATVFGTLSHPESLAAIQCDASSLPVHMIRLLERVDLFMQENHPNEATVAIFDEVEPKTDAHLSRCMTRFLFSNPVGMQMERIVVQPFWVDSATNAGSQVADLVAHVLMNGMLPEGVKKPLGTLHGQLMELEFRSRNGMTRGIRHLKPRLVQAGAEDEPRPTDPGLGRPPATPYTTP